MSSGTRSFLRVVAENFDVLAGPIVGLAYPLYASIRAIESRSSQDDRQWLTYWILYSMIALFEITFARIIEWIPFWSLLKLILTCWLVVPQYSGASYVYDNFVKPFYVNPPTFNTASWYNPRKEIFLRRPDDVLTAAEKYIEQNGTEAFEKLIHKAADKKSDAKTSSYKFYEGEQDERTSYYYDDQSDHKAYYYDDYDDQNTYNYNHQKAAAFNYNDYYNDQKVYNYDEYKAYY